MKRRVFIACTMQLDAVRHIIRKHNIQIHIEWCSRTLHNQRMQLHTNLQNCINKYQDAEEIILSYGLCGNALEGICSRETRLVMPAFEDCISQLLYTGQENNANRQYLEKGCYYLTREWTLDKEAIVQQCEQIYRCYGAKEAQNIVRQIYSGYHTLGLIQTGAYDVTKIFHYAKKAAYYTDMDIKVIEGSCIVLEKLLLGNYDATIAVFEPGEVVKRKKSF